jgi:hypothetical protein
MGRLILLLYEYRQVARMNYNGFGAFCAAYAFLNTVKSSTISPEIYELLSGIPFGLKHREGDPFRILTPLDEPCLRVGATSGMLGYTSQIHQFQDSLEAVRYILALPVNACAMIGPIDMGFLTYLPLNLYYCGRSHYISVEKYEDNGIAVIDSEGALIYKYGNDSLSKILSVISIPNTNGKINIWQFENSDSSLAKRDFGHIIIDIAAKNLQRAETVGQGSQAILTCANLLENDDIKKWALKLCYELNYLIQRKHLLINQLLKQGADSQISIVNQQLDILCVIRKSAMYETRADYDLFKRLADYERELTTSISQLTARGFHNDFNN